MRPVSEQFSITQGFGSLATAGVVGDYNGSQVQVLVAMYGNYQPDGHAGTDIGCPVGTPVRAARSGRVVLCDWDVNLPGDDSWGPSGYFQRFAFYKAFGGRLLVIQHAPNDYDVYAHLSAWKVGAGQTVNEGDLVALSGDSSAGQDGQLGPHLHTERIVDMSYATGNGEIYGRIDPTTAWGGIAAMGENITPLEDDDVGHVDSMSEDAMKALAQKLWEYDFQNANGTPNRPIWILQSLPETFAGIVRDTINGVLRGPLKWFGFDGKQPSSGRTTTTVETALGFGDTIAATQSRQITELRSIVDQLALGQGVMIDYDKIAKAVNDEAARRLMPPIEGAK